MVQTREEDLMSARCCDGYQSSISLGCIDGTGSIQCLRRQLAQKDRELEQANKRADEAEAKLALVKEWAGRKHTISTRPSVKSVIDNISMVLSSFDELNAILADTPEVLAVGDGYVQVGPDTVQTFVESLDELPAGSDIRRYRPVRIIVKGGA